jgi:hypothetical protein
MQGGKTGKHAQANLGWQEEIGNEIPPSASANEDDRKEKRIESCSKSAA